MGEASHVSYRNRRASCAKSAALGVMRSRTPVWIANRTPRVSALCKLHGMPRIPKVVCVILYAIPSDSIPFHRVHR